MKLEILLENGIIIPEHEIEMSISRAGGPGGQHVNKTNTKVTLRWNVNQSGVFPDDLKVRLRDKLQPQLTSDGDLIVHSTVSRSLMHNQKAALKKLTEIIEKGLRVPKIRKPTKMSVSAKHERRQQKERKSLVKKLRNRKIPYD